MGNRNPDDFAVVTEDRRGLVRVVESQDFDNDEGRAIHYALEVAASWNNVPEALNGRYVVVVRVPPGLLSKCSWANHLPELATAPRV